MIVKLIGISVTMFCISFFLALGCMCGIWLTEWVNEKREGKKWV